MNMRESKAFWRTRRLGGQSLVEIALMMPVLLIILTGIVEMGFLFTNYLATSDAVRNATRFSSDSDYLSHDTVPVCTGTGATIDFYRQTACLAVAELSAESPTITLCLDDTFPDRHCPRADALKDDIIISVFALRRESTVKADWDVARYPTNVGDMGWSYGVDLQGGDQSVARTGMHASQRSTADVILDMDPIILNSGFVLVEINYNYYQLFSLPWFTVFVPDPQWLKLFSVWPLASATPAE